MPAKSKSQFRFMKMLENNPSKRKQAGMSEEDASEYTESNSGKKSYENLPEKKDWTSAPRWQKLRKKLGKE